MMKEALYLFCLTQAEYLPAIENQSDQSIGWHNSMFTHEFQGITAILTKVLSEEYNSQSVENKLNDSAWAISRLLCHEKIIENVMCYSPVFPARFGTLFSSLTSLEEQIAKHHNLISSFLTKVSQHEEWAVKGFLDRGKALEKFFSATLLELKEYLTTLAPGVRYLKEQHIRKNTEKQSSAYFQELCQNVNEEMRIYAADFREREISLQCSDNSEQAVVNWAFLIPRCNISEFHTQLNQINNDHAEYGLHFNSTGPWPPYSFCSCIQGE